MFKNPFSFNGRIRRLEYGFTYLICAFPIVVLNLSLNLGSEEINPIWLLLYVFLIWIVLAQGAKRCHDSGRSGWWQLLPFYGVLLLFYDGQPFKNEYGSDPKGREEIDPFAGVPEIINTGEQDMLPSEKAS
jgi:uncharacterized membrane protein YhaH (DUF805 family)